MKVYIIDTYEKYMQQGNEKSIHWVRGRPFCIREVELEWGKPKLENQNVMEEDRDINFGIFEDYDEAYAFIRSMQRLNGGLLD